VQQQHHRISGYAADERPEEDIEALIRARQSQYGHHSTDNSNIHSKGYAADNRPGDIEALIRARQSQYGHHSTDNSNIHSKGGGESKLVSGSSQKFRLSEKSPHAPKSDSDFSFDASASKTDDEIPIDASREQPLDGGQPLPSPGQDSLLLQKPSLRSAEVFLVKVQPPEPSDENYQPETNENEEENKEDETEDEKLQQNADGDVIKQKSGGHSDVIDSYELIQPAALRQDDVIISREQNREEAMGSLADVYLLAVMAGCAVAAVSGLTLAGVCWYRLHKRVKAASDVEYPAYGVTGPAKDHSGSPGDRKLAQSAQMYHYQHQKQQMIASERLGSEVNGQGGGEGGSEGESEEECEEGDYTVFECPGLATAGEMEVRNPLFNDQTPVATPAEK